MAATMAILKFFKRYLLQNHTSDWAETLWEASERHRDSELLLRLFRSDIIVAIFKFFKRHLLPNRKLDLAKTWWEASQWHRESELLKLFRSDIQDGNDISSQNESWIEPKLDGKHHTDTEIQNC